VTNAAGHNLRKKCFLDNILGDRIMMINLQGNNILEIYDLIWILVKVGIFAKRFKMSYVPEAGRGQPYRGAQNLMGGYLTRVLGLVFNFESGSFDLWHSKWTACMQLLKELKIRPIFWNANWILSCRYSNKHRKKFVWRFCDYDPRSKILWR